MNFDEMFPSSLAGIRTPGNLSRAMTPGVRHGWMPMSNGKTPKYTSAPTPGILHTVDK